MTRVEPIGCKEAASTMPVQGRDFFFTLLCDVFATEMPKGFKELEPKNITKMIYTYSINLL